MNKKGFTLIELLVVVLIIGILSAIAISQYQKAVIKSQMARAVQFFHKLVQLEQAYYDTHGVWLKDIRDFDVDLGVSRHETNTGWFFPPESIGGGRIEMLYAAVPQINWVWNKYSCRVDFRLDRMRNGQRGMTTSLQKDTNKAKWACNAFDQLW